MTIIEKLIPKPIPGINRAAFYALAVPLAIGLFPIFVAAVVVAAIALIAARV